MQGKSNDLLSSIMNYTSERDKLQDLETRANHSINSLIHLMESIDSEFDTETANDLKKRIFLCIKNKDYKKFERGLIKLLKERTRNDE